MGESLPSRLLADHTCVPWLPPPQILGTDGEEKEVDLLARETERQICAKALPSVFSVEVSLRYLLNEEDDDEDAEGNYTWHSGEVNKLEKKHMPLDDAIEQYQEQRMCTGFCIAKNGNTLRIQTCAHALADVYSARYHKKMSLDEVNAMFRFDILCIHQEHEVLTKPSKCIPSLRDRYTTAATLICLDTEMDLLVLETDARDLYIGKNKTVCPYDHPTVHLAELNPPQLSKVVLVGWPPQRANAVAAGQVSNRDWTYDAITSLNVKGYKMKLLEINGMTAGNGFSGGPCLSTDCSLVGVYHGVFNGNMSYAVSLQDIRKFLDDNQILTRWDDEEKEGCGT